MPFTEEDAKKHKKDLTLKQSKQWARVAESIRKREIKKGKSEEEAAVSAIKQANGVVMNTNESKGVYSTYKTKQVLNYEAKLTVHQEKAHLVVPVVMMVEGVHNGSQGAVYHSIDELGKFPESWNGRPVVIYHPEDESGNPISANSPDIVDKVMVGHVYNTTVEDNKLKAEVWFDEDKLNSVSPETLQDINDTKEVEVSLGMFTENEDVEGEYNGEAYVKIAHNHRPDHLAILPDQVGACSCKDGCGLGANSKNNNMEIKTFISGEKLTALLKSVNDKAFAIHVIGDNAKHGYNEKMQLINAVLRKLDKDYETEGIHVYEWNYLEEMYDDYFIYSKNGNKIDTKLYKQEYNLTTGGEVELSGNPVEVHKQVEYVLNSNNNSKKEEMMANEKCTPCVEKKVNDLIANSGGRFIDSDKEWLQVLTEVQLDKLIPEKKTDEDTEDEKKKVTTQKEKVAEVPPIQALSDEDKAALAYGKKQLKERRDKMIQGIQANTEKGVWDDAVLNVMSEDMLERVYKSVKKEEAPNNYSLNAGADLNTNTSGSGGSLYPCGVVVKN